MNQRRRRILVVCEYFLPGFKAGGPVRSMANLLAWLGDEYQFWILTRDRDLQDRVPYAGVVRDQWIEQGPARIRYVSPPNLRAGHLRKLWTELAPDLVYLNSLFAPLSWRCYGMRRCGLTPATPLLIAPRGELSAGALSIRRMKKRLFLGLLRRSRLNRVARFHATAREEMVEIETAFGPGTPVACAPNLGARRIESVASTAPRKRAGQVSLAFLSRLVPKKNLLFLLERLREVTGDVTLTCYGPAEDTVHFTALQAAAARLPGNVRVTWAGAVPPGQAPASLAAHHFFVLPTLGENFGHAIVESWQAGVPTLLSDRTPWRGLAAEKLGWDLPLEEPPRWHDTLREMVAMDTGRYDEMRQAVRARAQTLERNPPLEEWRHLFAWAGETRHG